MTLVRIVFAADSHLNRYYARMTPDQLAERRARLRSAWRQTIDHAVSMRADVYIHGGDLFDSPNPRSSELIWTAEQFQRLADAGIPTLLIGGNHDIPKSRGPGASPQELFGAVRLAHVFTNSRAVDWWQAEIAGLSIAVGGLPPDPRLDAEANPLALLAEPVTPPAADCVLLVTHYAVEGTLHPLAEEATIRTESIAELEPRIDCLLVGHIHSGSDMTVGGVPVVFAGPTERMSFGELDVECGFAVVEVDAGDPCQIVSRKVRVEPQPMRRETVRAADIPPDGGTEWLMERVRHWSAAEQILQVRIAGSLARPIYQGIRFLDIWHQGSELNFYFDLDRQRLTVSDDSAADLAGAEVRRLSPRAEIARVAESMARTASSSADRELVETARDLILDQYGGGTIEEA